MFGIRPDEIEDTHPLVKASINAQEALLKTAGSCNKTHATNVDYLLADGSPAFLVLSKSPRAETMSYLRDLCDNGRPVRQDRLEEVVATTDVSTDVWGMGASVAVATPVASAEGRRRTSFGDIQSAAIVKNAKKGVKNASRELKNLAAHNDESPWSGIPDTYGLNIPEFSLEYVELARSPNDGDFFGLFDDKHCRLMGRELGAEHPVFASLSSLLRDGNEYEKVFLDGKLFDPFRLAARDVHLKLPSLMELFADAVHVMVNGCLAAFDCELDGWGGSRHRIPGIDLMLSVPRGTHADVERRAQCNHVDMPEAVYRLVGKAHSIIATDHNGRSLRILDKHGQLKLVHLPPSSMTLMHGRLVHAGWGVPSCDDDLVPHAMLFAYVLMGPPVDASDDDIHTALQTLPQLMSPPWDPSLEWPTETAVR